MKPVMGVVVAVGCTLGASPAVAEPVPVAETVAQINAACVTSRAAFLDGGTVRLRLKPAGRVVQTQRYDPVTGRVGDTGWPSVTQRGVGTFDRSGFVLDARLRKAQVRQAARYLGFQQRPWVLLRDQYGVIANRTFRQFLRMDLVAPDRFADLDSMTVPSQAQRCVSHLLAESAKTEVDRTVTGTVTSWKLSYRLLEPGVEVRVRSTLTVEDGLITSGSVVLRSATAEINFEGYAQWAYGRPQVAVPPRRKVVSQREWIRATDAVALVSDIRYLAASLEGRSTLAGLRRMARTSVRAANRGHEIPIRVREVPRGVELSGRNPYTRETVVFEVVIEPVPTAVSRRVR